MREKRCHVECGVNEELWVIQKKLSREHTRWLEKKENEKLDPVKIKNFSLTEDTVNRVKQDII